MNTLQCRPINVKRRFGYALNLFHRELNSSDVFRFYSNCFICIVCYSQSQYLKIYIVHLLMTDLCCKQSRSRSQLE